MGDRHTGCPHEGHRHGTGRIRADRIVDCSDPVQKSSLSAPDSRPLFEECFVLFRAVDEAAAAAKADTYARAQRTRYQNERGEWVTWTFKKLIDVSPVLSDELVDGAELYARHFYDYEAYRRFELMLHDEKE